MLELYLRMHDEASKRLEQLSGKFGDLDKQASNVQGSLGKLGKLAVAGAVSGVAAVAGGLAKLRGKGLASTRALRSFKRSSTPLRRTANRAPISST